MFDNSKYMKLVFFVSLHKVNVNTYHKCDALRDLVLFVQLKNVKTPEVLLLLSNLQAFILQLY